MCFHRQKVIPIEKLAICAICIEPMYKNLYIFDCSHRFHMLCALNWINRNQSCPLCRNKESRDNILKTVIEKIS